MATIGTRIAPQSPLTDAGFVAVQPEAWAGIGQSTLMAKAVASMANPRRVCFDMGDDSQHDNPSSTARLAALSLTYVILNEWTRVQRFTIHRAHTFPFAKVNIFLPSARYLLVFGPFPPFSSTSCHTRNRHNSRLSPNSGHELDLRKPARENYSTKWGRHSDSFFSNGIHDDDGRNSGLRRSHRPAHGRRQPSSSSTAATVHSSSSDPWGLMLKCLRTLLADPAFQEAQDNEGVQAILPFGPDGTLWPTGKAAQSPTAADLANVAGIPNEASGRVGNVPHAATALGTSVAAAGPSVVAASGTSVASASGTSVASAAVASEADLVTPAPNVAHSNASGSCLSDTAQAGLIDLALHHVGPRSRIRFTTVERMTDGFGVCAPCGEWWMRR